MKNTGNYCTETKLTLHAEEGILYVARAEIGNSADIFSYNEQQLLINSLIPHRRERGRYYYRYTEFLELYGQILKDRRKAASTKSVKERRYRGLTMVRKTAAGYVPYSPAWQEVSNDL